MIEDMTDRNMSPLTQAAYIRSVVKFAAHYRTSPDKLTFKDVRNYQVHLVSRGLMRFLKAVTNLARRTRPTRGSWPIARGREQQSCPL